MPHGTVWQGHAAKVAPRRKYMWTLRWLSCDMPFDAARTKNLIGKLSVPSKEAVWQLMSKGFQNGVQIRTSAISLPSLASQAFATGHRQAPIIA